jgi:hypothetical protein
MSDWIDWSLIVGAVSFFAFGVGYHFVMNRRARRSRRDKS